MCWPSRWTTLQGKPPVHHNNPHNHVGETTPLKVAFGYNDAQQIELIQAPAGMHSVYSEGNRQEMFHHTTSAATKISMRSPPATLPGEN